jgi:hypothetical protein
MKKRNTKSTLEQYAHGRTAISDTGSYARFCVRDLPCREIAAKIKWYENLKRDQPGVGLFRFTYEMCVRERLLRMNRGTWKLTYDEKIRLKRPFRNKQVTLKVSKQKRPFN